jgi:hypothetical protein
MTAASDFTGTLSEAMAEIRAVGLSEEATAAYEKCFAAYSTSSEWLGEVGEALTALLREHGDSLPETTQEKLRICLREVGKVWPKYRP